VSFVASILTQGDKQPQFRWIVEQTLSVEVIMVSNEPGGTEDASLGYYYKKGVVNTGPHREGCWVSFREVLAFKEMRSR
jgi:hypothetical protein